MRFGSTIQITKSADNPITSMAVAKYRDYEEIVNEVVHTERVQIMQIQDMDAIIERMRLEHALQDHGVFLENRGAKMYVVKCWIEKLPVDN